MVLAELASAALAGSLATSVVWMATAENRHETAPPLIGLEGGAGLGLMLLAAAWWFGGRR